MGTSVKGLLKGIRYITQIFDEEKDNNSMQIGFPTDVKHIAHIGSDGPATNAPSWMNDFKPQENENAQVVSRVDANNNQVIGEGVGLQELLPPPEIKQPKHKKSTRRKSETTSSQNGSPPRRNSSASLSDVPQKPSRRHHRSRHGSIDSNDPSVRRRRVASVTDIEAGLDGDNVATTKKSTSRPRKLKGSGGGGGELSMRKTKGKSESTSSNLLKSVNSVSDKD